MSGIDWAVLALTLFCIVAYGMWKSRNTKGLDAYILAGKNLPWYEIGISVIATQASAITFLSAPGQAFSDGLRFMQMYFGIPFAMIVICVSFIPVFKKLNVYTAYEYLETRFDLRTRILTAFLFLLQRGLSTGITIYAPSIVLSSILEIPVVYTTLFIGCLVIFYTVYGGSKAVNYTQMLQMGIIFAGLAIAAVMVIHLLPSNVGLMDVLHLAGKMDKLKAIDTTFDLNNRYNIWSGIIGGFFLHLSYFGTDQSQVGRQLTGESLTQSRLGLIFNGIVKIPMQFFILLIGILVFSFYQFHSAPVFFNTVETEKIKSSVYKDEYAALEKKYDALSDQRKIQANAFIEASRSKDENVQEECKTQLQKIEQEAGKIRKGATDLMLKNDSSSDVNDTNYVFLYFVMHQLPRGLIGLLIAVIFLASMGATSGALSSLASTTMIDVYRRLIKSDANESHYLYISRLCTFGWGVFCTLAALFAARTGNLIEAVNILGSLFYGTILGIFLVAFYFKSSGGKAVFFAAILAEGFIAIAWVMNLTAFLWLNVIGCILVILFSVLFQFLFNTKIKLAQ